MWLCPKKTHKSHEKKHSAYLIQQKILKTLDCRAGSSRADYGGSAVCRRSRSAGCRFHQKKRHPRHCLGKNVSHRSHLQQLHCNRRREATPAGSPAKSLKNHGSSKILAWERFFILSGTTFRHHSFPANAIAAAISIICGTVPRCRISGYA